MAKNPFEIFGLSPDLVGSLSEKDLFGVLKSMYRALAKTVHPDVVERRRAAAGAERAIELNLAFEALDLEKNPVAFRRHRRNYLARRPHSAYQKSLVLQKELLQGEARLEQLAENYFDRLAAGRPWAEQVEPEKGQGRVPFPLKNLKLGLLDVAINQNLKMAPWSLGSNYKEMNFDVNGEMSVRLVGRRDFTEARYIHLLGTVPVEEVELKPLLDRPLGKFFKSPTATLDSYELGLAVLNQLSREQFQRHVLGHLKAEVTERAYLFSLHRPEFEKDGTVTVEGVIIKVDKLDEV